MDINTKEIQTVKTQASKALLKAESLTVKNQQEYSEAVEVLSKIKTVKKMVKENKEAITKPINESLKNIRALFSPIEENTEKAEDIIKSKMRNFLDEEEERERKEKEKIAHKLALGKISEEKAIEKIEDVKKMENKVETKTGGATVRIERKFRITDEFRIPREYLTPDLAKIKDAVLKQNQIIDGVEVYEEKNISISTK